MLLYHYTTTESLPVIKWEGLIAGKQNTDTVTINNVLMGVKHEAKIDRNNCLFFHAEKPLVKSGVSIISVDSAVLDKSLLYTAEFYYSDAIWVNLKSIRNKLYTAVDVLNGTDGTARDIRWHAISYWDSLAPFDEGSFFDEELELEVLYLGAIPANQITFEG